MKPEETKQLVYLSIKHKNTFFTVLNLASQDLFYKPDTTLDIKDCFQSLLALNKKYDN